MFVELTKHFATINQFSGTESQKIALAVDEAITNVIKHSYKNSEKDNIKLEFYSQPKGLKILVEFSGIPPVLKEMAIDLKKMIREKKKSGLGVELIKRIMDSVEYSTVDNTNRCEMIKWKK